MPRKIVDYLAVGVIVFAILAGIVWGFVSYPLLTGIIVILCIITAAFIWLILESENRTLFK